jgi:hypothetical protein
VLRAGELKWWQQSCRASITQGRGGANPTTLSVAPRSFAAAPPTGGLFTSIRGAALRERP